MRKYIFLDIDGVFNVQNCEEARGVSSFMPGAVTNFNWLLKRHEDAKVVLSSAWRYMVHGGSMTVEGFEHMLRSHGLKMHKRLIGVTPQDWEGNRRPEHDGICNRGKQIEKWLFMNSPDGLHNFVVIDDCPNGMKFDPVEHVLVQTDGKVGLTKQDVKKAYEILCKNPDCKSAKVSIPS